MLMCSQLSSAPLMRWGEKQENARFYYKYTVSNVWKHMEIHVIQRILCLWGFARYRTKL